MPPSAPRTMPLPNATCGIDAMRLLQWVNSLGRDRIAALSRIRIERDGINVTASIARTRKYAPLGVYDEGELIAAIPAGPAPADDATAVAARNPPVKMHMREREPDALGQIATGGLRIQIEELRASGILGGLNVERIAGATVISAHAATQDERNAWLRGLNAS